MMRFLFPVLIFLSLNIQAQLITPEQAEAYANELVKQEFLTAKGRQVLLKAIKNGDIEVDHPSTVKSVTYTSTDLSRETILQFCYAAISTELMVRISDEKGMAIEERITPKEPLDDSTGRTYSFFDGRGGRKEYAGCITQQTSTFGYTRNKTLTTFLQSGLIDEKIFNDCRAALQSKQIRDEVDLLHYILHRSTYYRFYDFNKKEQENYISSLVMKGILTGEGKERLLKSYKDYELRTIPEILKESPRYRLVDLHAYEPDPKQTYPVIFEAVKKLLPPFNFSHLTAEIVEEEEGDLIRQDVKLSFEADSILYQHAFFHDYRKEKPELVDRDKVPSRVDQDFHKGINQWLTDIESPFRLYTINILDDDERAYGERSVGLLLLKEGEDSLISSNAYLISRESFDPRLSRKNIRILLTDLEQYGFFSHLSPEEMNAAKEKISSMGFSSLQELLHQFPRTIVLFDWETGNLKNPYEDLTREFAAASRNAFTITGIMDGFGKAGKNAKQVKYGFVLNGKKYERMLKLERDWLDPEFMDLLLTALKENKVDGSFHQIIFNGQESGYIFLTSRQFEFISKHYPDLLEEGE